MSDDPREDYLFLSLTCQESLIMTMGLLALVSNEAMNPTIRQGARDLAAKVKEVVREQKINVS